MNITALSVSGWSDLDSAAKAAERTMETLKNVKTICTALVIISIVAAIAVTVMKVLNAFTKKKGTLPIRNIKDTVLAGIALVAMIVMLLIPTANFMQLDSEVLDYLSMMSDEELAGFSGWSLLFDDSEVVFGIAGFGMAFEETGGAGTMISFLLIMVMLISTLIICLAVAGMSTIVNAYFDLDKPFFKVGKRAGSKCLGMGILYFFVCLIWYGILVAGIDAEYVVLTGYIVPILAIVIKIAYTTVANMIPEDLVFIEPKEEAPVAVKEAAAPVAPVAPAEPVITPVTENNALSELKHYKDLLDNGLISEEDYEQKKAEYLSSINSK